MNYIVDDVSDDIIIGSILQNHNNIWYHWEDSENMYKEGVHVIFLKSLLFGCRAGN